MSIAEISGLSGFYSPYAVQNSSVRYGMNAASNMEEYTKRQSAQSFLTGIETISAVSAAPNFADDEAFVHAIESFSEQLEKDEFTPSKFRYRYSADNGEAVDKMSLMGAAYEETGRKNSVSVSKMNKQFASAFPSPEQTEETTGIISFIKKLTSRKSAFSAKALDSNRNGRVETEEYAAFLALADIKSKDKNSEDISRMDGTITDEGVKEAFSYLAVNSKDRKEKKFLTGYMQSFFGGIKDELGLDETAEDFRRETKGLNIVG